MEGLEMEGLERERQERDRSKPNLRSMQVHSATCSCSIEQNKQRYIGGFFPKTGIFAGFSLFTLHRKEQRSCDGQGTLYFYKGAAQLIQVEAQLSRVPRNSEGCSVSQKGSAQLRRLQLSSEGEAQLLVRSVAQLGCSVAQKGAAQLRRVQLSSEGAVQLLECSVAPTGCNIAQLNAAYCSLVGCSVAHEGAAQLSKVQRSSVECSLTQWKNYTPLAARVWAQRKTFCFWKQSIFYFWGSSEAAMGGGRAAPHWAWLSPKRWARPRAQNPLYHIFVYGSLSVCLSQLQNAQALLFVLVIKLTRRIRRGRDRDGEIGKRQIIEGGCEETFHC